MTNPSSGHFVTEYGSTAYGANWYFARHGALRGGIAAFFGAIAGLGQAPFDLPILLLVGFYVAISLFVFEADVRRAALSGMAFGTGYFAVTMMWIVEPFFVDAPRHGWMAPFALLFLSVGLSLFWGLAFGAARWLGAARLTVVLTLTAAEILRAYVFTGFPWGMPAQAVVNGILGQLGAWGGPHGVNLAILGAVAVVSTAINSRRPVVQFGGAVLSAGLVLVTLWPVSEVGNIPVEGRVVRLIQPNAAQHEKWNPEMIPVFFQRQLGYTSAPAFADGQAPDLIIWPETALPTLLENAGATLGEISRRANGVPVVLGLRRVEGFKLFNTLVVVGSDGGVHDQYDKHHLVPFGEYLPMGEILARYGLHGLAASEGSGFSAGPGPQVVDIPGFGRALALICYEAVFPQDVNNTPVRPRFLLQITNDAWFGGFSGPYQHLAIARMRAIELGLPMVRVANTGVSAMIDARGRVTQSIPLGEAGFVDAPLPIALGATLYSRTKDWAIVLLLVLALGARCVNRRETRNVNRH